jgi:hypothetical protein
VNGNYSFPNVPVGNDEVRAYHDGYIAESSGSFTVTQGTNTLVPTLKLPQAGIVTGTVTNASHVPIGGASVSIVTSTAGGVSYSASTTTNSSGQYTFSAVPVGSYVVHATATGYFPNSASLSVAPGPDAAPTIVLTAAPTITVTGPGTTASPGPVLGTLTPTFTWDAAAGVSGYVIYLYDLTAQKSFAFTAGASATSYTLAAGILTAGHDYSYTIRALDGSVSGPEGTSYKFQV